MRSAWLALILLSLCATGCASWPLSSKWAAGNADYDAKYDRPYPKRDGKRYARMAKQAVDARHVEGMTGFYGTVSSAEDDGAFRAASGEIGCAHYPTAWLETRGGFAGIVGADTNPEAIGDLLYLGLNGGVRAGSPTRVSPFVGVGAFGGISSYEIIRAGLEVAFGDDDEDDPFPDPALDPDARENQIRLAAALYPEVGLHVWATDKLRVTGSLAYYVTTEGRSQDYWLLGCTLARFTDPHFSSRGNHTSDEHFNWPEPGGVDSVPPSRLPSP